jgi:DNA-binding XRE family transcriptional regulator
MNASKMRPNEGDVTVLRGNDGKPEFAVLRWSDYCGLRARAGESIPAEGPPTEGAKVREAPAAWVEDAFAAMEDSDDVAAAEAGDEAWRREKAAVARVSDRIGVEIEAGVPHEVVKRELEGTPPVRAWREYRGHNQARLAALAGISRSYLAQIEAGERAGTVEVIARLARNLGCLIEDLVPEAEALRPLP